MVSVQCGFFFFVIWNRITASNVHSKKKEIQTQKLKRFNRTLLYYDANTQYAKKQVSILCVRVIIKECSFEPFCVQCCFTSTATVRTVGEPSTATLTFTHLLSSHTGRCFSESGLQRGAESLCSGLLSPGLFFQHRFHWTSKLAKFQLNLKHTATPSSSVCTVKVSK